MKRVPRASLSISLITDEDYSVLMAMKGGAEAFGVFVATLVVGRERLQRSQARRLSGTDSLRFDNSTEHILSLAHVSRKQFDRAMEMMAEAARRTNSEPWMSLDGLGHLVIRSFFKFNTAEGWGGPREGSGRPEKGGRDRAGRNQLDSNLVPSRNTSGAGAGAGAGANSPPTPQGGAGGRVSGRACEDGEPFIPPAPQPRATEPRPELDAIEAQAERLFPGNGWSPLARDLAIQHGAPVVAEALRVSASEQARSFKFIMRVAERLKSDPKFKNPPPKPPEPVYFTAPPNSPYRKRDASVLMAKRLGWPLPPGYGN